MSNIKIVFKYAFKDLRKQKVRSVVGIFGVMISVGLLAIVLFLSDSIAITYIDYMAIDAGNADMKISVRHYQNEPEDRSNYFEFNPLIDSIRANFDKIGNFVPRMDLWGNVNISESIDSPLLTNQRTSVFISGINFTLENEINFGAFVKPETTQLLELPALPLYHCAIYYKFNDVINYAVNDTIEIRMRLYHGNVSYYRVQNFTIDKIFDFQLKFPYSYTNRPLIIVDVETLYEIFGSTTFQGRCNELILTFKNGNEFYDARDLSGSKDRVRKIAGDIRILIGINQYNVEVPKLEILGFSELLSVGITIVFVFVSMISMLISGVLINGILKTSVEERIREFGIFRTLGATKKYNLSIVLVQGFLICNFGTISGILGASLLTQFLIVPIAESIAAPSIPGLAGNFAFSISFWSILIAYLMGLIVGMVVSLFPALKVMRLQLIESIHPYRHEDTLYHLKKKASVNYKLVIIGVILAANGAFVLFVIPRILISADLSLIIGVLIALLLVFLIGTTLAGLGLMPLILRFFIQVFRLFSKKLAPVYRIFIFRYARRNTTTTITFAFTFSFVIFTAAALQFLTNQVEVETNLSYGSDLVIETTGWQEEEEFYQTDPFSIQSIIDHPYEIYYYQAPKIESQTTEDPPVEPTRLLTTEFEEVLLGIDGIEKVSSVIASPSHLTQIYSEEGKEFTAEIGDYAGLFTQEITLLGIDEEYFSTINTNYIEFTQGEMISSFDKLFDINNGYTCIVSESLSVNLDLIINDVIRMVIQRGDESEIFTFKIVGVAANMPGFFGYFSRSSAATLMAGVMVSHSNYLDIMDIPPIPYVDKFFIKLRSNSLRTSETIEELIEDDFEKFYDFEVFNLQRSIILQTSFFSILDIFFTVTLDATIIISLFGLLSSSYSTIIERKKEIGIIRTLGLKGKQLNHLFNIEALIIMLSSGTIGVIVGWVTQILLSTSVNLLNNLPNNPIFPISSMINIYLVSIIATLIGMKLLLRKIRKKKIVEIYRETM
ncbi:MAG: ABC transporter permease [Promethearchaeia archaeon]